MAAKVPDHTAVIVPPATGRRRRVLHLLHQVRHIFEVRWVAHLFRGGRVARLFRGGVHDDRSYDDERSYGVPDRAAPRYQQWTFAELEAHSNRYANGLERAGINRRDRVVVMVGPGLEFIGLVFALFKIGAIPVMIDPGMGLARMVDCIARVEPHAFVGIPRAQLLRVVYRRRFPTLRAVVTVGRRLLWGGHTLRDLTERADDSYATATTRPDEIAAILFTTGSTGPPKGVVYEHGMFHAQVVAIQAYYGIEAGEVDLPAFPLFALFSTAMGMTCVIPDMDPSKPAQADPAGIVQVIRDHHVTNSFGSPALWRKVGRYCVDRGIKLPTLRRVLTAGAPVSWQVLQDMRHVLAAEADVHTPYGATESLPVSSISGRELLEGGLSDRARLGRGTCVGKPDLGTEVRLIRIIDEPIEHWSNELVVPDGRHGEIVVCGPVVTKAYFNDPKANALHKIYDGDRVWHRVGDVGYRDADGRLWFCGRKAHRVVTEYGPLFTVECEAIFNEHQDVCRSALVGVGSKGRQTPVIIIEPLPGRFPKVTRRSAFTRELLELGAADERTRPIRLVLFYRSFPVDIRHNAKIRREELAGWAAEQLV